MTNIDYVGDELSLFEEAHNWKAYLRKKLTPFIRGDVAEVGAGKGSTTLALHGGTEVRSWLCIEPDAKLYDELKALIPCHATTHPTTLMHGTLRDLPNLPTFNTIIYIDVLEHIEDDAGELIAAFERLEIGGRLVVLCPAFQAMYSPFDKAIGHFRRYTLRTLRAVAPKELLVRRAYYLDSAGLLASLANKMFLRQSLPTAGQVQMWDRVIVPISRITDNLFKYFFGKSVLVIWEKT